MDKILLLNPPGDKLYQRDLYCSAVSKANYYWPSIDLLILSGILSQNYEIDVIDAIAEKIRPEECISRIEKEDYRAIIFLTGTASWRLDFDFVSRLKRCHGGPLLIGNGDILLFKASVFFHMFDFLDAVLFDYTSPDILYYLDGNFDKIRSMAFRHNGKIEIRKEPVKPHEFSYPVPRHEKFPLKKYLLAQGKRFPFTTCLTSFGCPFRCTFCVASALGYKYRPVENVMTELKYIASLGIKEIFFEDFTFEAKQDRTLELCRRMAEEGLDLTWVTSSRANTLDRELLTWMKRAGCHTLLIGVENGNEELLEKYSKGVTKDQVRTAFSLCREFGIRVLAHFIIGLPGETEETARKTIEFAKELDCDLASFNIAVPALGTKLREMALRKGWLQDDTMEFDSSDSYPVLETSKFSREQAWRWRKKALRQFYLRPSYLWKMATASRSAYQWKVLILNGLAVVRYVFS